MDDSRALWLLMFFYWCVLQHFIGQVMTVERTGVRGPAGVKMTLARAPIRRDPEYFSTVSIKHWCQERCWFNTSHLHYHCTFISYFTIAVSLSVSPSVCLSLSLPLSLVSGQFHSFLSKLAEVRALRDADMMSQSASCSPAPPHTHTNKHSVWPLLVLCEHVWCIEKSFYVFKVFLFSYADCSQLGKCVYE